MSLTETQTANEAEMQATSGKNFFGFAKIAQEVAQKHGVSVQELKGDRRFAKIVAARNELYYRCMFELPHLSSSAIARLIGGRDHSTVLHAVKKYCRVNGLDYPPRNV